MNGIGFKQDQRDHAGEPTVAAAGVRYYFQVVILRHAPTEPGFRGLKSLYCNSLSTMNIAAIDDPFDLTEVAVAIRRSSNFRFAWRFFWLCADDLHSTATVAASLSAIIHQRELHSFLADSMDDIYPRTFEISPLHVHASIVTDNEYFLDTLTRASLDRLGAYSRSLSASTSKERAPIHKLFSSIGPYLAFHTQAGNKPDCNDCRSHNNDLISNWFFDVAWDYTFLLTWPSASVLWMGCLTDTD